MAEVFRSATRERQPTAGSRHLGTQELIELAVKTPLHLVLAAVIVLIAAPADVAVSSPPQIAGTSPKWFEQWLNQDVVYIISKQERAAFLNLERDEDRKNFVDQFWWRRNPDRESIENTFESEHYRRIAYANSHFGTKAKPGWQTERGHVYVVYGNPDSSGGLVVDSDPILIIGPVKAPEIKFKELSELLTARIVRNQISFEHATTIQPVTDCTALASIAISVPAVDVSEAEKPDASRTDKRGIEILMRVVDRSGRIVQSAEGTLPASSAPRQIGSMNSPQTLTKVFPLFAGLYRVQIAIMNAQTQEFSVQILNLEIPPTPVTPQ